MGNYITHHINLTKEDTALFKRMKEKVSARSFAATLVQALRALEEKEAERDAKVAK